MAQKLTDHVARASSHAMGQVPIYFEQNAGQAEEAARFLAVSGGLEAFITKDGLAFPAETAPIYMRVRDALGARFDPEEPTVGVSNYYLGPRRLTALKHYERVRGRNIRPGIDIVFHGNGRELEYDFEVHPGGDPESLRLGFSGKQRLDLEKNGDIRIVSENDDLRFRKPVAWQDTGDHRRFIDCDYRIAPNGDVELTLGPYDHSRQLTIDPIISFSTYLSSSGNDTISAVTVDATGVYVTGASYTSNFPVTSGTNQGNPGLFVTKFDPSGSELLYSTIIAGGSGLAIAADGSGNVYVGGTAGTDYSSTTTDSGQHMFVTKLNSSGEIAYATVLAGDQTEKAQAIAIDSSGAAYVAGITYSSNFPVTAGAVKTTLSGTTDAVVAKLNASGQVVYATYLGGSDYDGANGIAIDGSGDAYVAGFTQSSNFPTTAGAYSTSFPAGEEDGFVTEINPSGTAIVTSTLLGGSKSDTNLDNAVTGIARDPSGNLYVTGWSNATNFPATLSLGQGQPIFVTKLNSTLSTLLYSVVIGISQPQSPVIAVDDSGAAYVAATGLPPSVITPGGFDTAVSNMSFFQVAPSGDALSYAGQFGTGGEVATSLAIDGSGGVYLAGFTNSAIFPTTTHAYQTSGPTKTFSASGSGFVVKIDLSSPTSCVTTLGSTPAPMPANGGSFSFDFTIPAGCPWGTPPESGGAVLSGQTAGISTGVSIPVNGTIPPNPTTSQRTINIHVSEKIVSILQRAGSCYEPLVTPSPLQLDAAGDLENVNVNLPSLCTWNAAVDVPWLILGNLDSSYGYQTGDRTLTLSGTPFAYSQRTGTLTIANQKFTVTQTGTGTCTASAAATQPTPPNSGNTGEIRVSVSNSSCNWSGYSLVPWIEVAAAFGQGNGSFPYTVAANPGVSDRSGQILVADQLVTITQAAGPAGAVIGYTASRFAGGNSIYQDGVPAIESAVGSPAALFYDTPTGNFYFADQQYQKVRVITPDGMINTVAPNLPINYPTSITVDPSGNIYIGDGGMVWGVTENGRFAGTGTYGFSGDGGPATSAQMTLVGGLAADSSHVYISDQGNARIRAVSNGTITTIAGGGTTVQSNGDPATQAQLVGPAGLILDAKGDLLFADGNKIRTVSQGIINTLPVTSGSLSSPQTMAYDVAGDLFITEFGGPLVERSSAGQLSSVPLPQAVQRALSVATDPGGNLYVGDDVNHAIWKLAPYSFCSYTLTSLGSTGGSLNLGVITGPGCNWTATSDVPWITVSSGSSGTGNGTVQLTISSNLVGPSRSAIIAVAGWPILIFQEQIVADFNRTGHSDVVWQDPASGASMLFYLGGSDGTTLQGTAAISGANPWHIVAVADFNQDGQPDLMWQDPWSGETQVWFMGGSGGTTIQSAAQLTNANPWRIVTEGDFNGDGHPDLVWQDPVSGFAQIWYLGGSEGTTLLGAANLTASNRWHIAGAADFNGDGVPDLVWQDPVSGATQVWYMGGAQGNVITGTAQLTGANSWRIVAVADFNLDGHPDVVWQDPAKGKSQVWFLTGAQGTTVLSTATLTGANKWRIVAPR